MKFYIFKYLLEDDSLESYSVTDATPEEVAEKFNTHPASLFKLDETHEEWLKCDFKSKNHIYLLEAIREYEGETYEYKGLKLYPPPMFLPDHLNAVPVAPKGVL